MATAKQILSSITRDRASHFQFAGWGSQSGPSWTAFELTVTMPTVMIGGEPADVQFSGLSPQFVGLNQINVTVPQVKAGVVPLQISIGGITTSNQVTIAVQ